MKVRYCQANNLKNSPCPVGWGSADSRGTKSCLDEPKEANCKYLVEIEPEVEVCPCCGTPIGIKEAQ